MQDLTETIRKRYNRIAPMYNSMDTMIKPTWREELLRDAKGKVLEVGVGTGANLSHYPPGLEIVGIDFSPRMLAYAQEQILSLPSNIQLQQMDAQHLEFPNDSFDTVVATCVFCSVPDPIQGLREIHRVLKPTGHLLMIEHMLSDNPVLALALHILNPVTVRISGANVNRKTIQNLQSAGFHIADIKMLAFKDIVRRIDAVPHL
ncbi:class I SAM-dependent methyltransferase [Alicyclobacillus sp. ALC3]|uniref:class I SAM-dependent methyltransferase n=1 Tax=Alicyclobacillus sp. ALC3 TaxID=2796143 RepID=UPI002379EC14|nr:class I SAM-dependent methyltransferase [Alicyclobacillus sp. ALC3]WDL96621.1 class I SAM-dependent methyltransferase [Alicyclobacillus sp. ALC3]